METKRSPALATRNAIVKGYFDTLWSLVRLLHRKCTSGLVVLAAFLHLFYQLKGHFLLF